MENLKKGILKILTEDARTPHSIIAVMLGVREAEVSAAVSELENNGAIVKYTAVVNTDRLPEERVEALIEVKVSPSFSKGFDAIAAEIYKFPEVKSLYLMSGGFDLAVFVEGKSLKDVAMFVSEKLSSLDKVLSTATHFILKKYKTDGVLLEPEEAAKRLKVHV